MPPRTRLAPPTSMLSFSTAGLDQGKFVGASASSTLLAANRAWRSVRQSSAGVGDQTIGGLARGEVALHHPAQQPVVLPRSLAEAAIALGRPSLRAPSRHAGELDAEATRVARGTSGMARQSRDRATGGPRLEEPADADRLRARHR